MHATWLIDLALINAQIIMPLALQRRFTNEFGVKTAANDASNSCKHEQNPKLWSQKRAQNCKDSRLDTQSKRKFRI
jgi:hypothetical protein